jgi:hypothetical protein
VDRRYSRRLRTGLAALLLAGAGLLIPLQIHVWQVGAVPAVAYDIWPNAAVQPTDSPSSVPSPVPDVTPTPDPSGSAGGFPGCPGPGDAGSNNGQGNAYGVGNGNGIGNGNGDANGNGHAYGDTYGYGVLPASNDNGTGSCVPPGGSATPTPDLPSVSSSQDPGIVP